MRIVSSFSLAIALLTFGACTTPIDRSAGPAGLRQVTAVLQEAVDRGEVGGIVALIHHRGETVQVDAVGHRDDADTLPMRRDAIFRIASMTKPITSVAAMILLDEGRFDLTDPVSDRLTTRSRLVSWASLPLAASDGRASSGPGGRRIPKMS